MLWLSIIEAHQPVVLVDAAHLLDDVTQHGVA